MQNGTATFDSLTKDGWHVKDEVQTAEIYCPVMQHKHVKAADVTAAGEREDGRGSTSSKQKCSGATSGNGSA